MRFLACIVFCGSFFGFHLLQNSDLVAFSQSTEAELATGICGGSYKTATGTARIIKKKSDLKKIKSGDIIVTIMTQDSWVSSMKNISGIITNTGDNTCHAALFGKKHSIPVLVGVCNATEKIKDGHKITIDCSQGMVGKVYALISSYQYKDYQSIHVSQGHQQNPQYLNSVSLHEMTAENHIIDFSSDVVQKHERSFTQYVLKMKNDVEWRNWIGEKGMIAMARKVGGCGDFAVKCIPLVYELFDQDESYIKSLIKKMKQDYMNTIFELYNQKPGDMEWLAQVCHSEHIKKISLPGDIDKQELIKNPEKYKKIIDQKKVNPQERDVLIVSGLFVRYWVENKCKA